MTSIYNFKVKDIQGETVQMSQYKEKVLLIVNVASKCGFTPQYKELEELYQKYKEKGLVILGFPCNQFGYQESASNDEIHDFCQLSYQVSFPLFSKIKVNGNHTEPLFNYLKKERRGLLGNKAIKWNFTKFLVNKEGKVIKRFAPSTSPFSIENIIQEILS